MIVAFRTFFRVVIFYLALKIPYGFLKVLDGGAFMPRPTNIFQNVSKIEAEAPRFYDLYRLVRVVLAAVM